MGEGNRRRRKMTTEREVKIAQPKNKAGYTGQGGALSILRPIPLSDLFLAPLDQSLALSDLSLALSDLSRALSDLSRALSDLTPALSDLSVYH